MATTGPELGLRRKDARRQFAQESAHRFEIFCVPDLLHPTLQFIPPLLFELALSSSHHILHFIVGSSLLCQMLKC